MFTEDGSLVALDVDGKAAVTMDFACQRCRETASLTELSKFAKNFHDPNFDDVGINPGLSGTWWDAQRAGEGFVLDVGVNDGTMIFFGTFYTYDNMGNPVFLIGSGVVPGGPAVTIDVYLTDGAMWGDDFDAADVNATLWGTATFTFSSCGDATVTLTPTQAMIDLGYTAQTFTLTRDLIEAAIQCPTLVNNAN